MKDFLRTIPFSLFGAFSILGMLSSFLTFGQTLADVVTAWTTTVDLVFAWTVDPLLAMVGASLNKFWKNYIVLSVIFSCSLSRAGYFFGWVRHHKTQKIRLIFFDSIRAHYSTPTRRFLSIPIFLIVWPIYLLRIMREYRTLKAWKIDAPDKEAHLEETSDAALYHHQSFEMVLITMSTLFWVIAIVMLFQGFNIASAITY